MKNKSIALGFMRIGNLTIDEAEKLINNLITFESEVFIMLQ